MEIGTKLPEVRKRTVLLQTQINGEWVSIEFAIMKEDLTKDAADQLARKYRKKGYLARRVSRTLNVEKSWYVAIAGPRARRARKTDL